MGNEERGVEMNERGMIDDKDEKWMNKINEE